MLRHIKVPQSDRFQSRLTSARQKTQGTTEVITDKHLQR